MTEAVETLKTWVREARAIAFFGGAGVSTESGIPDFRSTGGLYHQEWKYPPETILSHTFYKSNPEEFFRRATAFEISRKGYQEGAEDSKRRQSAFSGY